MIDWKKYYSNFMKVSSVNAGLFIAYRLYSHYRKNKLTYIEQYDYTPKLNQPYQVLDFTNHINNLNTLDFKKFKNGSGGYVISCFQYKNIYFSIVKYENVVEPHYKVNVDMSGCVDTDREPNEICLQFINALDLNEILVLWSNLELNDIFTDTKANKLKLSDRIYKCSCGYENNRDTNGSFNVISKQDLIETNKNNQSLKNKVSGRNTSNLVQMITSGVSKDNTKNVFDISGIKLESKSYVKLSFNSHISHTRSIVL